jgi:hypothetical protein
MYTGKTNNEARLSLFVFRTHLPQVNILTEYC